MKVLGTLTGFNPKSSSEFMCERMCHAHLLEDHT